MRVHTILFYVFTGLLSAQGAVSFTWLTVGDVGNSPDQDFGDGQFGQVNEVYRISAHEVTNAQYAEFLNAVDPMGGNANLGGGDGTLYNSSMSSDARGGITLNGGNANGSKYEIKANMGSKPVNYTSFYDAMRFNNWLHNGQGAGSTESGAYDLSTPTGLETRESGASYFIPSEDEWYKAAYYDPGSGPGDNYWLYPTQSDSIPTVATADVTGNINNDTASIANYNTGADWNAQNGNVTTVGSGGVGGESYYGAADLGGNVWEWNEAIIVGSARGLRGGSWVSGELNLRSSGRVGTSPANATSSLGFRVASLAATAASAPEPNTFLLMLVGLFGVRGLRGKQGGAGVKVVNRIRRKCVASRY